MSYPTPTPAAVAYGAARYAAGEFSTLGSWLSYEDELAAEWMKDQTFRCVVESTIPRVMQMLQWNRGMQSMVAQYPDKVAGVAALIGHIVAEWAVGKRSIDAELSSF
jgi:hypothetical protein